MCLIGKVMSDFSFSLFEIIIYYLVIIIIII